MHEHEDSGVNQNPIPSDLFSPLLQRHSLLHTNLQAYYEGNFSLMHHHKWSIAHIDNLMPWEKEIYVNLLVNFLKEEERRMKEQQASGG